MRSSRASLVLLALLPCMLARPASACTGDCNGGGTVTIDELVVGVSVALGVAPLDDCRSFDRDESGVVTIDELVDATNAVLDGCPSNQPPVVAAAEIYRSHPGFEIRVPIEADDPEGQPLRFTRVDLPGGADLDLETGIIHWVPAADQIGPFYARFAVTDDGSPSRSVEGTLPFKITPLDDCTIPSCDPATGCVDELIPLGTDCCVDEPTVRVAEPDATCPEGRALFVGRNRNGGVGRLQNCDRLRVAGSSQGGGQVRLNVEARCVNARDLARVDVLLKTSDMLIIDQHQDVYLNPTFEGYGRKLGLDFPIGRMGAPDGTEGELTVTLTDFDGVVVSTKLRPVLTPDLPPQLPD